MLTRPFLYKWEFFSKLGYKPRSGQRLFHKAADHYRYLGYFVYPRGGKSYSAAMEVAATGRLEDHHVWIVGPTYNLGSKEFGYIYNAHAQSGLLQYATTAVYNVVGGNMRIEYPWGWWCEVKSAEKPDLLLAEELDEMILSESARLPETVWYRSLFNRAEKRLGRVYIPTTPKGYNWIHQEFWKPAHKLWEGVENPDYDRNFWALRVSHLPEEKGMSDDLHVHFQGGVYTDDTVERARKKMPPQLFREQFGGDFVSYSGTVFKFDSFGQHVITPFDIPDDWPIVIGYDHGASGRQGGMTAITFWAYDNELPRNVYLWDMIYDSGHGAGWYINEIKNKLRREDGTQRPYNMIVVDPSAKQVRIELSLAGMPNTTPEVRDFKARYVRMNSLLEEGRVYVFKKKSTEPWLYEIGRYEWKEGVKGEPRGDMVQGPDDAMDSSGYALLHRVTDVLPEQVESAAWRRTEVGAVTKLNENEKEYWNNVRKRMKEMRGEEDFDEVFPDSTDDFPFSENESLFDDEGD